MERKYLLVEEKKMVEKNFFFGRGEKYFLVEKKIFFGSEKKGHFWDIFEIPNFKNVPEMTFFLSTKPKPFLVETR